jgi:hypothetical protein
LDLSWIGRRVQGSKEMILDAGRVLRLSVYSKENR